MRRPAAAVLATVLHAAVLACALVRCAPAPGQPPTPPVRPGERTVEVRLLPSEQGVSPRASCERTYRGIGIQSSFGSGRVHTIAPGGPAERAGVQIGDVVLNDDDLGADRYPVGHQLALSVERDGRRLELVVTVGRICFED